MKGILSSLVLILAIQLSVSAGIKEKAHFGQVVLNNNEIVEGNLYLDQTYTLLFIEKNEKIDTIRATDVQSFNYKVRGKMQEYATYDIPDQNNHLVPHFFRIVWSSDQLKVLERLETSRTSDDDKIKFLYLTKDNSRVNSYLKIEGDNAKILDKALIQRYTRAYYRAVSKYASDHKLSFNKEKDLIKILDYYASLKK